ncbi:MAG TPA: NADH-quinone oxidoreductase subunit L [Solirubrobacteraceae bacterium]|nr:NADH-quinone oxidoreductase subunit L [Solirubrobacteraceae bacterium]
MAALLWLTVALPLVAAALVRLAPGGDRLLAVVGAAAAAVPAWVLLVAAARGESASTGFAWLAAADLDVGLRLDELAAAMSATVATVGLLVMVYATGYFADDPRRRSALAGLLGFLAVMQGLVLADGYLTLLVFWELVGAASARLIAFNRDEPLAAPGAVRAFLTTRTADVGLYLAVLALFAATGSLAFTDVRPDGALGAVVALGLIVAAVGKSAQAPLQTWLAGAMAGPTPVSALLHSATMVAAGVYLLMRSDALLAGWPLVVVGWVGAVSAVAAAAIALAQDDLKRVLAGSTSSQLGLMFVGLAAGGPAVALFHLVAHAVGKACLFLAAGIFQHERGSTRLAALRGVGRRDRQPMACFAVGALSIAAVPPLAGFWSKEHIAAAAEHHVGWFILVLVATAGAAAYLLRPALVLWRGDAAAEPPAAVTGRTVMLVGAGALAAGSMLLGLAGPLVGELVEGRLPSSTLSLALSLLALAAGVVAVLWAPTVPGLARRAAARELYTADAQHALAVRPTLALAAAADAADRRVVDAGVDGVAHGVVRLADASDVVERRGVDAAVDAVARLVGAGGRQSRRLQTGRLYEYLRDSALGAAAVAVLIALAAVL